MKWIVALFLLAMFPPCTLAFDQGVLSAFTQPNEKPLTLTQIQQSTDWYDCGEVQNTFFCHDSISYYKTSSFAQLEIEQGVAHGITLYQSFSHGIYNALLLSLRQDGFMIATAEKNDQRFDVEVALTNDSKSDVERALFLFLNTGAADETVTTNWILLQQANQQFLQHLDSPVARLISNGKNIELRFEMHQTQVD